jgi:hypothetical protein
MVILSQGVQQLKCLISHSPPFSTQVKDKRSYTYTPLYTFVVWTGKTVPFTFQIPSKISYTSGYSQKFYHLSQNFTDENVLW